MGNTDPTQTDGSELLDRISTKVESKRNSCDDESRANVRVVARESIENEFSTINTLEIDNIYIDKSECDGAKSTSADAIDSKMIVIDGWVCIGASTSNVTSFPMLNEKTILFPEHSDKNIGELIENDVSFVYTHDFA